MAELDPIAAGFEPVEQAPPQEEPQPLDPIAAGFEPVEVPQEEPFDPIAAGFMPEDEFFQAQSIRVRETFGDEAGDDAQFIADSGRAFPTFEESMEQKARDEQVSALDKVGTFLSGAPKGIGMLARAFYNTEVIDKVEDLRVLAFGSIQEKMDRQRENQAIEMEGAVRNIVGLKHFATNIAGAIMDGQEGPREEAFREYRRELGNIRFGIEMENGAVKTILQDTVSPERLEKMMANLDKAGGVFIVDPSDPKVKDRLLMAEIKLDPLILAGAPLAKTVKILGLGKVAQATANLPRALTRAAIKGVSRELVEPAAAVVEFVAKGAQKLGEQGVKRGKQFLKTAILVDTISLGKTGFAATGTALGGIAGGKALEVLGRGISNVAGKARTIARVAGDPGRQKRLADILSTEHGIKLAGVYSAAGGKQFGDIVFNAMVDGTQAGALNAAQAVAEGAGAEQAGEAFGMGLAFAAPLGGVLGPQGAGASTALVEGGRITQRSRESFGLAKQDILDRKVDATAKLDQARKLEALPDEVKAAMGEFAEAGVSPDVIMLDPKDFKSALKQLPSRPDITTEFNNGALYFPDDNVIMLNAEGKMTGGEGLRIMGEELAHAMVSKMVRSDPSLLHTEATRLHDPKGRAMPFSKGQMDKTVRVNKDISNFTDAYNKAAKESGAPQIVTFEHALHEFYGAQAGITMASNKSVFSPKTPLWLQKTTHAVRGATIRAMGKIVRDTPDVARNMDKAADTPIGRHMRDQFKIWQQEGAAINKRADEIFTKVTEPKDATTPDKAETALKNDPTVDGKTVKAPRRSGKKKQFPGGLAKLAESLGGTRKGKSVTVTARQLSGMRDAWKNQFPASEQTAALAWFDQLVADADAQQTL